MSEEGQTQTTVEPVVGPVQQNAATATPPKKEEPRQQQTPQLDPDKLIEWQSPDGKTHRMTLQEMADRASHESPKVDPEILKRAELLQRSQEGDSEATRQLMESYLPKQEARRPEPGSAEDLVQKQQERIDALERTLNSVRSTTDQINENRNSAMLKTLVTNQAKTLPHLAKIDNPSEWIAPQVAELQQLAKMQNYNLDDQNVQLRILTEAMARAEGRLSSVARTFGGTVQQASNAAQAQGAIDDQTQSPTHIPAGFTMLPNGAIVDQQGRSLQQNRWGTVSQVQNQVPSQIPGAPSGGAPVGTSSQTAIPKKFRPEDMFGSMRAKSQQLGNQE